MGDDYMGDDGEHFFVLSIPRITVLVAIWRLIFMMILEVENRMIRPDRGSGTRKMLCYSILVAAALVLAAATSAMAQEEPDHFRGEITLVGTPSIVVTAKDGKVVQAYKWFYLAASRTPPGKIRYRMLRSLNFVAGRMTPDQITEARRLIREWMAKAEDSARISPSWRSWRFSRLRRRSSSRSTLVRPSDPRPSFRSAWLIQLRIA